MPRTGIQKKNAPVVAPEQDWELPVEPGMGEEKRKTPLVALGVALGFAGCAVLVASEEQQRPVVVADNDDGWWMVQTFLWLSHSPCWMGAFLGQEAEEGKTERTG